MNTGCFGCKWVDSDDRLAPCPICNSNYDMYSKKNQTPKQCVDFLLLWDVIQDNGVKREDYQKAKDNLQLFFKLLATKPTFAEVAHRELNKLIK